MADTIKLNLEDENLPAAPVHASYSVQWPIRPVKVWHAAAAKAEHLTLTEARRLRVELEFAIAQAEKNPGGRDVG